MTTIDPEAVNSAFLDSLWRDEELVNGEPPNHDIIVEGILAKYGFNPVRLEAHRAAVAGWLAELPTEFRRTGGGGWSFLNACLDRNGDQWTGLQLRMEQLFAMGIGLKLAAWQLPRDLWGVLPGGMPYAVIDIAPAATTA